jgi:hypothetical protein
MTEEKNQGCVLSLISISQISSRSKEMIEEDFLDKLESIVPIYYSWNQSDFV